MGQIVKRRKKGRPPKSDLEIPPPGSDLRRSHRRRNVKYVFDLDDYFDEDELFAEDDSENRLKLLLKLESDSRDGRPRRAEHVPDTPASSSDNSKPSKKRKIDGYLDGENGGDSFNDEEDEEEVRESKAYPEVEASTPEVAPSCGLPMPPDKKPLELILDKLQKKDIYGVYAEPVDPDELPDYHDMIENPMDFATVRNKLRNGSYATFEKFESDIFLICSNAMQYNAPNTVYHKQARTIQEMAKRKFEKIKLKMERETIPAQKMRSGPIMTKQIKMSDGSDLLSSGATARENRMESALLQALGSEKPSASIDKLVEGNSFLTDNNYTDKPDESYSGKGPLSRFGRKSIVNDENRASCTMPISQPVATSSDSIFSTFDGETKQLVPVGLYSDNSYARSLARFSATLGPAVWEIASRRIEQALPQDFKFGPGWVGEYEPPPTPALFLQNFPVKEPPFLAKLQPTSSVPRKSEKDPGNSSTRNLTCVPLSEHKLPFLGSASTTTTHQPIIGSNIISEMNPCFFLSPQINLNSSQNQRKTHVGNTIISSPNPGNSLTDPIQLVRQMSETAQKLPNHSSPNFDPNNAAALAAARAWMSVGSSGGCGPVTENGNRNQMYYGESLYNSQVSRFRGDFNVQPLQGSNPMMVGVSQMMQQQPMVFPKVGNGDMSRLQFQSGWRNMSPQMHSRQRPQESFPPDLNIGFQTSGSGSSSGLRVDSQQPDLALQL